MSSLSHFFDVRNDDILSPLREQSANLVTESSDEGR